MQRLVKLISNPGTWLPGDAETKNPPASAGDARDLGLIPGLGRSLRVGNGNPLQYSCLENSMDRGAWWTTVHEATKNQTWLNGWIQHNSWMYLASLKTNKLNYLFFPTLTFPHNILCSARFYMPIFGDHLGLHLHHDSETRFLNDLHWLKIPLFPME